MWSYAIPQRTGSIDSRATDGLSRQCISQLNSGTLAIANTQLTSEIGRGGGRGEEDCRVESSSMLSLSLPREIHVVVIFRTSLWFLGRAHEPDKLPSAAKTRQTRMYFLRLRFKTTCTVLWSLPLWCMVDVTTTCH